MENNNQIQIIESKIFTIRGQQVMLDEDLASIYEVKTLRLNEPWTYWIRLIPVNFEVIMFTRTRTITSCR